MKETNSSDDFVGTFNDALDKLEADAKKVGLNLTSLCRSTGISRATPDRWRKSTPTTIQLLATMQGIVREKSVEKSMKPDDALIRSALFKK